MLNPQKHTKHVQLLSRMKGGSPISHNCIYIIHVDQEQLHVNYYCIQGQEWVTIHVLCCNRICSFRLLHIIIIWVDFWYHYKLDVMQQCIHFDLYENFVNTSKSLVSYWRVCCVKLGKFSTDALLTMYWSRYKYIQIWYIELSDGSIVKFTTNWIMISIRINQI